MHTQPMFLLDKKEIIDRSVSIEEYKNNTKLFWGMKGVYFLILEDEIVYVGSTARSIRMRIWDHRDEVPYNKVYAQNLPDEYIYRAMEILYIGELEPRYNKAYY